MDQRRRGGTRTSGVSTFLFTDIEGSTRLLRSLGDGYEAVLAEHRRLIREAAAREDGEELGTEGDSFFIVFESVVGALRAALAAQVALTQQPWPDDATVRVRMGLHTGEAHRVSEGFVGLAVHRAARIAAAAHGGQILVSGATARLGAEALPEGVGLDPLGPHELKDFDAPEELFQLFHPDLDGDFPPPRTEAVSPTNLPMQLTSFVGRDEELRVVEKLLDASRLVTLTGAGGAGKTRLAQEAGGRVLTHFSDGVWWVDLAPVTDRELVAHEACLAVGLRAGSATGTGEASESALDRLVRHLRSRRALLVLDNCEHLIASCADFAEAVLQRCPEVHLLATSREPLGVAGETTRRVPSLSVPADDAAAEDLAAFEAVRLFCQRAQAVRDDFRLDGDEATGVAQICRRLDGIPLAIELAAARVRSLSCVQIADRLDDRFRLLTGGSRTALPRQRTLEALVDWSYDLLTDPERALLRRLSVFAGGFLLEAVEAVCSGEELDEVEVLDLVTALVDKSLVVADRVDGDTRYRLLETIRQYGREKLLASDEVETFRGRHLRYFADLAEAEGPFILLGPDQVRWLDRFDAEHDNFRTAMEWAVSAPGLVEEGLRIGAGLGWFWWIRGYLNEGRTWLGRVLGVSRELRSLDRAMCLALTPWLDLMSGGADRESLTLANEAVSLVRSLRGAPEGAYVESFVLWVRGLVGRDEDAEGFDSLSREALEVARAGGVRVLEAAILHSLGIDAYQRGKYAEARRLYEEALAISREIDMRVSVVRCLNTMAILSQAEGDLASAKTMWEETLRISRELGDKIGIRGSLGGLISAAMASGAEAEARALAEEGVLFTRAWGDPSSVAAALNELGYAHLMAGRWDDARDALEEALSLLRTLGESRYLANLFHSLGEIEEARGDYAAARMHLEEGLEVVPGAGPSDVRGFLLASLGHVVRRQGSTERACILFAEALGVEGGHWFPVGWEVSQVLLGIGFLAADEGDLETATRILGASEALRQALVYRAPVYDEEMGEALSRARVALGPRFDELYEEGRAMSREAATELGLAWARERGSVS